MRPSSRRQPACCRPPPASAASDGRHRPCGGGPTGEARRTGAGRAQPAPGHSGRRGADAHRVNIREPFQARGRAAHNTS
jgi:hypothetical protein